MREWSSSVRHVSEQPARGAWVRGDARCGSRNTAVDMEVDEVVAVEAMEVGAEEGSPDAGMGEMAMLFSLRSSQ